MGCKLIAKEAAAGGLDVTAAVREKNETSAQKVLKKDLFDLISADIQGFDAVADTVGVWVWTEEKLSITANH